MNRNGRYKGLLKMNSIILLYGMPGSYKTSISQLISTRFNLLYLSPSQYGKAHDMAGNIIESKRYNRYDLLFQHLNLIKNLPIDIVLDGCFDFRSSKTRFIDLVKTLKRVEVLIFKCISSDIEKNIERINTRNKNNYYNDFVNPNQTGLFDLLGKNHILEAFARKNKIHFITFDSITGKLKTESNSCNKYRHIQMEAIICLLKEAKYIK